MLAVAGGGLTSIATLITRVRADLHDEDSGSYRWDDSQLQRHLEATIREYSDYYPREMKTAIATTAGSRDVSLSGLTDLIEVVAVEWPVGQYPRCYVEFSVWSTVLTMLTPGAADGSNAAVYWRTLHDVATPSHPAVHDEMIARGAAIAAARELASYGINRVSVAAEGAERQYADWADRMEPAYRKWLERGRRSVGQRRMYTPESPRASQTTDSGPGW